MLFEKKKIVEWHKADLDNRMYLPIEDGKKIAMPRYYKLKLYSDEERGYLKGVFERKNRDMDERAILQGEVPTCSDRMAAVDAAFDRMYLRSEVNRNKI